MSFRASLPKFTNRRTAPEALVAPEPTPIVAVAPTGEPLEDYDDEMYQELDEGLGDGISVPSPAELGEDELYDDDAEYVGDEALASADVSDDDEQPDEVFDEDPDNAPILTKPLAAPPRPEPYRPPAVLPASRVPQKPVVTAGSPAPSGRPRPPPPPTLRGRE